MNARSASLLQTRRTGPIEGQPWLLLHDRYGTLDDSSALAVHSGPDARTIAVQAPRLQTTGGLGHTHGHYWYFGAKLTPELSTLGDALFELETLLLEIASMSRTERVGIIGGGEGGVMALLLALLWPEKLFEVVAIDAGLPHNLSDIPIEQRSLGGLKLSLINPDADSWDTTRAILTEIGAVLQDT